MSDGARGAARDRSRRRGERVSHEFARFRSLVTAGALAGVLCVALIAWHAGPRSLLAPGPLARPHRALACTSCHAAPSAVRSGVPSTHCGSCHAEQASLRAAHAALSAQNRLLCSDCHGIHAGDRGIAFERDGRTTWFGNDGQRLPSANAPAAAAFVPLLPASACERCHDTGAPNDPAAHCFGAAPNGELLALCFDEHRRPARASTRRPAERDAAIEKARAVALSQRAQFAWLGLGAMRALGYVVPGLALAAGLVAWSRRRRCGVAQSIALLPVLRAGQRRLPRIDAARCLGCHACVDACPYDVLEIRRYVAIAARPGDCCGAGPCVERCPNGSLTLSLTGVPSGAPELSPMLEASARANVFLAGDVTGGSLIRNALRQGTAVAELVAARVAAARGSERAISRGVDLLVVGAGPAGLAAALRAKQLGISVELLEQASVAESIRRFSRNKLVLDAEAEADERLPLWIGNAPKEQLLKRWLRSIRMARLGIRERVRLQRLEARAPAGFLAHAQGVDGQQLVLEAEHVLIAVGARGTPRPLGVPIPAAALDRVHYELSDARTFAGRRVIVVGLGDVAMESAIALTEQQDCEVTVLSRGSGFRRGKQRNIETLSRLSARGRVKLLFDARITRVTEVSVGVELASGERVVPYDALFVHIGALPAQNLLQSIGIAVAGQEG